MRPSRLYLALAVSSAALLLAPGAQATSPGANGVLAGGYREFSRSGDQFFGFKLIRPGGRLTRTFAKCENNEFEPEFAPCPFELAFSPDGSQVAYRRDDQLAVADIDGTNLRLLGPVTPRDSEPAWSPDGSMLVFSGESDPDLVNPHSIQKTDLYLIGVDGTGARRLTTAGGHAPAWSSRGTIAYVREGVIYRLNPRTGSEVRVASGDSPDFSPSGRTIVYSLARGLFSDVYRVRTSGEPQRRLLSRRGTKPAFSPDGRRIAFVRETDRQGGRQTSIRIVNRDGTRQRVLRRGFERPIGSTFFDYTDVAWRPLP